MEDLGKYSVRVDKKGKVTSLLRDSGITLHSFFSITLSSSVVSSNLVNAYVDSIEVLGQSLCREDERLDNDSG